MLVLDKHSAIPYFKQVSDSLEKMIVSGFFSHGDKLPTLTEMKSILNISLKVIAQAYDELSKKGFVYSRRGKGYFVSYHQNFELDLNEVLSIENKLIYELNMKKTIILKETISEDYFVYEKLQLSDDEECFHIKQSYGDDKKNLLIQDIYFPKSLFPRLFDNYNKYIIIPTLIKKAYGYHISRCHNKYSASHSSVENQLIMKLSPNEPLWRINSVYFDLTNKPICLIKHQLSGEYVTLSVMIDAN
jgi:DNA-binding GntR family transcriptional regulator